MKVFQFIMAFLMLLILNINISSQEIPQIYIAGTIKVSDPENTGQKFIAEFKNLMKVNDDESGNKLLEYLPEKENEKINFALISDTVYSIKFQFPETNFDDMYEVVNADGTEIEPLSTVNAFFELNWKIKKINEIKSDDIQNINAENSTKEITQAYIEEGSVVLNEFLLKTRSFENKSEFTDKYKFFNIIASSSSLKKKYIKVGYDEIVWDSLTFYEKSLWELLYFGPKEILEVWTFKDKDEFLNNVRGLGLYKSQLKKYHDANDLIEALNEVWSWHWDCYKQTGETINILINGIPEESNFQEVIEITTAVITTEPFITEENNKIEAVITELEVPENNNIENTENNGFIEIIKAHLFTIFLTLTITFIFAIVFFRNKYKKE